MLSGGRMVSKNPPKAVKLGDLLVEVGLITSAQLGQAAELQKAKGGRLGDLLVDLKFLTREVLLTFLGKRSGAPFVSLAEYGTVSSDVLSLIQESVARRQKVLPLRRCGDELTVAMADPLNVFATDDLRAMTGCEIKVVIADEEELLAAVEMFYGDACEVPSVEGQVRFDPPVEGEAAPVPDVSGGQAANLLNVLLENAARAGVSAVHLEPGENTLRVRYRLSGKLLPRPEIAGKFQEGLAVRVKTLAHMNPLETWAPQEGHIRAKVNGRELDIRVSTLPTFYGEKIVLRFVEDSRSELDLEKMGLDAPTLACLRQILETPGGLLLIAGPAGSGKTDFFYACLLQGLRPDRHVATLEDPVENCLPGVIQIQARPHVGLTVASGVRSLMRQDPDLIGVGDLRQDDDVLAALEAVQAGVPVIATLRVSSPASVVARLLEAGATAESAAAALKGVVILRQARALCTACRESYNLPREALADMGFSKAALRNVPEGSVLLFRSKGCEACGGTKLGGKVTVAAVVPLDDELSDGVRRGDGGAFLTGALREAALRKAMEGTIPLDEALR